MTKRAVFYGHICILWAWKFPKLYETTSKKFRNKKKKLLKNKKQSCCKVFKNLRNIASWIFLMFVLTLIKFILIAMLISYLLVLKWSYRWTHVGGLNRSLLGWIATGSEGGRRANVQYATLITSSFCDISSDQKNECGQRKSWLSIIWRICCKISLPILASMACT